MISDHQNRMAHRHLSFLSAAPSTNAVVLRAQVLIFSVRGAVRRFHQAVAQPWTAFARAAAAALTRRFVVAGAHAGPRCQMPGTGKSAHISAGLRPQHLGSAPVHPGNGIEPADLLLKRAQSLL